MDAAKRLDAAFEDFEQKKIADGIKEVLDVVKTDMPIVLADCKESVAEVQEIVSAIEHMSPAKIVKDILANKGAILVDVKTVAAELEHAHSDKTYTPDYENKIGCCFHGKSC